MIKRWIPKNQPIDQALTKGTIITSRTSPGPGYRRLTADEERQYQDNRFKLILAITGERR